MERVGAGHNVTCVCVFTGSGGGRGITPSCELYSLVLFSDGGSDITGSMCFHIDGIVQVLCTQ